MNEENKIILYQDDNEITRVSVRYADEDLWLTQSQLAEIYQTSKSNVSEHIKHIFEDGELDKNVVVRNFRITTQHGAIEGKTQSRDVAHYNLDMVIALGYRVQSQIATRFRRWATQRLHEYTAISENYCNVSGIFVVVNEIFTSRLRTYMLQLRTMILAVK